jgi:hypothetical protein
MRGPPAEGVREPRKPQILAAVARGSCAKGWKLGHPNAFSDGQQRQKQTKVRRFIGTKGKETSKQKVAAASETHQQCFDMFYDL